MTHDLPDEDPRFYNPWDGPEPTPRELYEGSAIQELYTGLASPWVVAQLAGWTLYRSKNPELALPGWDTPPEEAP